MLGYLAAGKTAEDIIAEFPDLSRDQIAAFLDYVASVANWSLSTVPRALPPDQTELVLASCNRKTNVGRRDYAVLVALTRLGLRASELVTLHFRGSRLAERVDHGARKGWPLFGQFRRRPEAFQEPLEAIETHFGHRSLGSCLYIP